MPCIQRNFSHGKNNAESRHESLGALPVLLVALHASLEVGDAAAISIAHQATHLRLQDTEVAENLSFEFVHHSHSSYSLCIEIYCASGRLKISAAENSE